MKQTFRSCSRDLQTESTGQVGLAHSWVEHAVRGGDCVVLKPWYQALPSQLTAGVRPVGKGFPWGEHAHASQFSARCLDKQEVE